MILVPIGRDDSEVRRNPWVSYVVIAINVLVFLFVNLGTERIHIARLEKKQTELVEYVQAHPYLELPESIRFVFHPSVPDQMAVERSTRRLSGSLPGGLTLTRQQRELEQLSADLLAMVAELPTRKLGFVPSEPDFTSRLTSMFVHADIFHLLGNLLFFFATGPFLEDVFGKPLFATLYLVSGIVATFAYQSQHPDSATYLVGASGAIAGVMGAYFVRFLRSRTRFLFIPVVFLPRLSFKFFMPAYVVFPVWFAAQVMFAMSESEVETSTAFSAHVGGFVVGLVTAGLVRLFKIEETHIDPSITAKISWSRNPLLDAADDARRKGDLGGARRKVANYIAQEPNDPDARLMACDLAREADDWEAWGKEATRTLDLYARRGERDLAIHFIDESIRAGGAHLSGRFYMRAADLLARIPDEQEWAKDLYSHVVENDSHPPTVVRALVRIAQMARRSRDFESARAALDRARSHPGIDAEYEAAIEQELDLLTRASEG